MNQDYQKLLANLETNNPSAELFDLVMNKIIRRQKQRMAWQISVWSLAAGVSLLGLWWLAPATWQQLETSGLWQFGSLLFSDFDVVSRYWRSFIWSVLESLPTLSLSLTLALLWLTIRSFGRLSQDIKILLTNRIYGLQ